MHNDIFWLDVSVDDAVEMKLIDSLANLSHQLGHFLFRHTLMFFELFE